MDYDKILDEFNRLIPHIREFQKLAKENFNISDIFQDNGGKLFQVLLVLKLQNMSDSREGNDAIDNKNNEYELKSLNILLTKSFSTNHHINQKIINKYRLVDWIFSVYEGIELIEIYKLTPEQLEPYYTKWEEKCNTNNIQINNPKIPLKFVKENGELLYKNKNSEDLYFSDTKINNIE